MTVVNPKSISGINSITTGSGSDNLLTIHTSDASSTERVRINSSGDVIVGSGITVSPDGDIFATGVTTATTFSGNFSGGTVSGTTGTFTGDVDIADKIVHTGDTDTAIRFSGADTIALETAGSERLRIDSSGRLLINKTSDRGAYYGGTFSGYLQVEGTGNLSRLTQFIHNTNTAAQHILVLGKSRGTSVGSYTVVQNSDYLGTLSFQGADGDAMIEGARIDAIVSSSPGDQDMPTALTFGTTADGASSTTERVRITSAGKMGVGTNDPNRTLSVKSNGGQFSIIDDDDSKGQFYCNAGTVSIWATGGSSIAGALDFATTPSGGSTASRLQISSAGDVTVNTGNVVIGTSGKGIDFSATSDGSGTDSSELLDDYEEGTWTPQIAATSVNPSITFLSGYPKGYYTKVGKLVTLWYDMSWSALPTQGSGTLIIQGFPYNTDSSYYHGFGVMSHTVGTTAGGYVADKHMHYANASAGFMYILTGSSTNGHMQASALNSSGHIFGGFTYRAA